MQKPGIFQFIIGLILLLEAAGKPEKKASPVEQGPVIDTTCIRK